MVALFGFPSCLGLPKTAFAPRLLGKVRKRVGPVAKVALGRCECEVARDSTRAGRQQNKRIQRLEMMIRILALVCVGACLGWSQQAAPAAGPDNSVCAGCHEQTQKVAGTAHAAVACGTCHAKHEEYPHPANLPKPVCASCHDKIAAQHSQSIHGKKLKAGDQGAPECQTCHGTAHEITPASSAAFRAKVPETCGMCHTEVAEQFKASVHGAVISRGDVSAPVCTSCHGEHLIIEKKDTASPVNARNQRETCGRCHGNVQLARRFGMPADRITSFDASFHGLAAKGGSQTVAGCASCHGTHNILPSKDTKSTVNVKNLPSTCGRCHPGAGTRFAIGQIHLSENGAEPGAVKVVRGIYLLIIPLTLGFMLLHNGGDFVKKAARILRFGRPAGLPAGRGELRMLPLERLQHALLASSFLVLAWTGFALQYPDQWWAKPLMMWEGAWPVRRNIHRLASVVFIAAAVLHVVLLALNRRLREHWIELIPRYTDVSEAVLNLGYNLGFIQKKPRLSSHSYVEKAEYWAVVWGGVVMISTGVLLWANNFVLQWLPKTWLDVATTVHWFEAILAVGAIVVWHFYSVIFDPDIYPIDTAFLTGRSPKKHGSEGGEQPAGD